MSNHFIFKFLKRVDLASQGLKIDLLKTPRYTGSILKEKDPGTIVDVGQILPVALRQHPLKRPGPKLHRIQ